MLVVDLQSKGFLGTVLDCGLSWSHLIPSQTRYDPLEALVRQNLDLQADQFNLLRIRKVPDSLMYNLVGLGLFNHILALFLGILKFLLHLVDEIVLEDEELSVLGKAKEEFLNPLHLLIVFHPALFFCTIPLLMLLVKHRDWNDRLFHRNFSFRSLLIVEDKLAFGKS